MPAAERGGGAFDAPQSLTDGPEQIRVVFSLDVKPSGKATFDTRQRMIDKDIPARHIGLQFNDRRAAGGNEQRLHVFLGR